MIDQPSKRKKDVFHFKQFSIAQDKCSMKVGTDGILLGAWTDVSGVSSILDIGTGTGLIAMMLAQRSNAKVYGLEINESAYEQTVSNFQACPWNENLNAIHDSVQDFSRFTRESYDLIVSNPPFFSGGTFSGNQDRNDVRHTVKLPNGDLLMAARKMLSKNGRFCVILPALEGMRFQELAVNYGLYCSKILEVRPKPDKPINRLLMEFKKEESSIIKDKLVVWKGEDQYTTDYIQLTSDFYLNF